jgi:hypothetical protein
MSYDYEPNYSIGDFVVLNFLKFFTWWMIKKFWATGVDRKIHVKKRQKSYANAILSHDSEWITSHLVGKWTRTVLYVVASCEENTLFGTGCFVFCKKSCIFVTWSDIHRAEPRLWTCLRDWCPLLSRKFLYIFVTWIFIRVTIYIFLFHE